MLFQNSLHQNLYGTFHVCFHLKVFRVSPLTLLNCKFSLLALRITLVAEKNAQLKKPTTTHNPLPLFIWFTTVHPDPSRPEYTRIRAESRSFTSASETSNCLQTYIVLAFVVIPSWLSRVFIQSFHFRASRRKAVVNIPAK